MNNNIDNTLNRTDNCSINIIDTLECMYINFKEEHNEKIKKIFELIDIESLIRPKLLEVSRTEKKLIKEKFGTEFSTVEYEKLIRDISNYLEYNKIIKTNQENQFLLEQIYTQTCTKGSIIKQGVIPIQLKNVNEHTLGATLEGYNKSDSFMKVGDYRLCSLDTLELNNQESGFLQNIKNEKKMCYILFVCNTCIVLENEKYDIKSLLDNFTDIKLIENCAFTQFKEFLHKRVFNSISDCESIYNALKNTLPKETINTLIENKIKNYINWNYIVTDDISDRIKVLELYNICKNECDCIIDSRQFSKILLKLNLKKKRYNDGVYYYGLKKIDGRDKMFKNKLFSGLLQEGLPIKKEEHLDLFIKLCETRENVI